MFNIYKDANGWQCSPPSDHRKKSDGADFYVGGVVGCTVCFANTSVFGVLSFDLDPGQTNKSFTGNDGDSTGFSIVDQGAACPGVAGERVLDDPYSITIGSTTGGSKPKKTAAKAQKPRKVTAAKKPKKPLAKKAKKPVAKKAKKPVAKSKKPAAKSKKPAASKKPKKGGRSR